METQTMTGTVAQDGAEALTDSDREAIVGRYLAVWNEADAGRRRALIAETWTEDATYLDPLVGVEGHEGIAAVVEGAQAQFAGLVFRGRGAVDGYGDRVRFSWDLGPAGGPAVAGGTDVGVIAGGRLRSVVGFLDFAPAEVMG